MNNNEKIENGIEYVKLLFSYRIRSKSEVLIKLRQKGYEQDVINELVKILQNEGAIDDLNFSVWWIKQRRLSKPKGMKGIAYELGGKGVDNSTIEKAFEIVNNSRPESEHELALRACDKIIEKYKGRPYLFARKKIFEVLKRKGFASDIIEDVIIELLNKESS